MNKIEEKVFEVRMSVGDAKKLETQAGKKNISVDKLIKGIITHAVSASIDELNLSPKAYSSVYGHGIKTVYELSQIPKDEIRGWYGVGTKTCKEIEISLKDFERILKG